VQSQQFQRRAIGRCRALRGVGFLANQFCLLCSGGPLQSGIRSSAAFAGCLDCLVQSPLVSGVTIRIRVCHSLFVFGFRSRRAWRQMAGILTRFGKICRTGEGFRFIRL